jgi:glycosyltransferase involved in cell wall biosynthesis
MPTVSVIVPNYNHARFLRKRVESVLGQTYQDFELILLDDCSTDGSREILCEYKGDGRVRIEFNDSNSGTPFKQWNKGVRMARGRHVWIAESDDYADQRFLERLVPVLEENAEVNFVYCRSWSVDEDDEKHGFADAYLDHWDARHWKSNFLVDGREECARFFVVADPVPNTSSVLFRKDIYERVGRADESFRVSSDYRIWAAMALEGKIAYVSEPLNYYRTHKENVRTRAEAGGLLLAEYFSAMRSVVIRVSPADPLIREMEEDTLFQRPPAALDSQERIQFCEKSLMYIKAWNLRHNRHVRRELIEQYFEEWGFALDDRRFAISPPGRWPYFLQKWRFYRYYFPTMSWNRRFVGLLRVFTAAIIGYRNRSTAKLALEHLTEILNGGLRRRKSYSSIDVNR